MDDKKKQDNLNSASLIDLKAELYRKQEEFNRQKLQSQNSYVKGKPSSSEKKPSIWSKKNAGVLERAQRDIEEKVEEENVFEKSKRSLEAKSKLYEKIQSGLDIPEEDGSQYYLVDFQKKVIDAISEEQEKERREKEQGAEVERQKKEEEEERRQLQESVPPATDSSEEWVDYVDVFGRSKRCLRKDLPELLKQDRELCISSSHTSGGQPEKLQDQPELLSADMRREMLRKKWEAEAARNSTGPIHYSNVQFDEIWSHGVGYFQFSKENAEREEQMERLKNLRQETKVERDKKERIKEKRKALMEARIAKVKQRKMLKGGLLPTDEENAKEKEEEEEIIGPPLQPQEPAKETKPDKEPELLKRDDSWRKTAPTREWDKGKKDILITPEERYVEDRRTERVHEFAPPKFYYKDTQSITDTKSSQMSSGVSESVPKVIETLSLWTNTEPNKTHQIGGKPVISSKSSGLIKKDGKPDDLSNIPLPSEHSIPMTFPVPPPTLPNFPFPPPPVGLPGSLPSQIHVQYTYTGQQCDGGSTMFSHNTPMSESQINQWAYQYQLPHTVTGSFPASAGSDVALGHQTAGPSVTHGYQTAGQNIVTSHAFSNSAESVQCSTVTQFTTILKPKIVIPKESILDTRLVQNKDQS
ncbi:hypothetical protein CHS0354_022929 [Potamilus streckersoni]|uniref:CCDC174 alpha/beta GRSR domain-containing protein n=1 Tax=Potamilus streckersoni TaxID=2493646 RepID=A0AAE0S5X8_9BIVA|nr:hypothetical protein CHS0354_022929 [Potamilus streckersoni]